jgi:hypothetical protein
MPLDDMGFADLAAKSAGAGLLGLIGRVMTVAVRVDRPKTLREVALVLAWEIPIGIGMGLIGRGAAEYAGLTAFPLYACTIAMAIAGPRVVGVAIDAVIERIRGGKSLPAVETNDRYGAGAQQKSPPQAPQ